MKTILRLVSPRLGLFGPASRRSPSTSTSISTSSLTTTSTSPSDVWPTAVCALPRCRCFSSALTLQQEVAHSLTEPESQSQSQPHPPHPHHKPKHLGLPKKKSPSPIIVIPRTTNKTIKTTNIEIDGQFVSFDNIFLRDACTCPRCINPSTQQKLFRTADIPNAITPRSMRAIESSGTLVIEDWENDVASPFPEAHVSTYDISFLRKYSELRYRLRRNHNDRRHVLWDSRLMEQDMLWIDYKDYMTSDLKLFEAVTHLSLYGLLFLRRVPETPEQNAVEGIAKRIGDIQNTFYGATWDVKCIPDAKNIAYTSISLGLHMDLLYFESPPGLQFLHCIRNTTTGGSSLFADSFRAATAVRMSSDSLFRSLCTFPVTYHYRNNNQHYHYTRPTVTLDSHTYLRTPRIAHVNWAPPFQAPFESNIAVSQNATLRQYVNAARTMAMSMNDPNSLFEVTLNPGECVVFVNRRVVHGRRAFNSRSGERWLKGTYVGIDAFLSLYRVLSERFSGMAEKEEEE